MAEAKNPLKSLWRMEPVEVRVTTEGTIEIVQQFGVSMEDRESVILLQPDQVPVLISWLETAMRVAREDDPDDPPT